MFVDALDRDARLRRHRGDASGIGQKLGQRFLRPQLVDGRIAHAAGDSRLRADRGNEDHIAGLQLHVLRFVAP